MKAEKFIRKYLGNSSATLARLGRGQVLKSITKASEEIIKCYFKKGGAVYLFGNGGSAVEAQHIAEELVGGFRIFSPKRISLSAHALTVDGAKITAIANDYGFDQIFVRQLEPVLTSKDVAIAISTSGNSANVIMAVELAKKRRAVTIGLTGKPGGKLAKLCDIVILVPSKEVSVIQEGHKIIAHAICASVEEGLFGQELLIFE